ncbi:MAG: ATP-binding protein [Phycisphaerae bacterium]|nr:ATP-binding protein [Phycisphaerae bacterium]
MYVRHITDHVLAALQDTPVVVLHGARQTGKSTLAREIASGPHAAAYLTMDRAGIQAAAKSDPEGFLAQYGGPVVLDEIQRVPELLLAIKAEVDRNRRPGRYLLTGSAHVLQLPKLADSLAGRMEVHTLRPLSQGELGGVREGFVDALFRSESPVWPNDLGDDAASSRSLLARRILTGGYPEAVARTSPARRRQWFEAYLSAVLMRDVKDLANIAGLSDMPKLMAAVAGRAGGLLNYADLARDVGLNSVTTRRYLTLLQTTFIVQAVQPWFANRIKRVVKSEKLYLSDSGLLAHLLDVTDESFMTNSKVAGTLLENFVAGELMKQISWSQIHPTLWHFRDHQNHEVDFVLEAPGGKAIVGVEVKASATPGKSDFRGLRLLAEKLEGRFHRGILLYTGREAIPFGRNLFAVPVSALWRVAEG